MKQKLFTLFLALVASVSAIYASDTKVDGIWYDFDKSNKTATVTYRGSNYMSYDNEYSGSVVIPSSVTYNGTTYSVTSIGDHAFFKCSSLTSVTIPNSVTSIGGSAFNGCSSLTSVTIGNSVTSIGGSAFNGCSSLMSINVDANNPNYFSVDGVLFNKNKTTLIQYPIGNARSEFTIPNSVTSIGKSAFEGCSKLTSITIPNSVTSIGGSAFNGCSSLTSVTIPNSVTEIGEYAFDGCSSLMSINVDANNPNYFSVDGVLFNKNKTTLIQYPIGNARSEFTIPNSVTSIGGSAFNGCSSLTSVTIPNSVTSIRLAAFRACSSLTSVTIGNGVTSIGSNAFYECSSLTSVTINSDAIVNKAYSSYNLSYIFGSQVSQYIIGDNVKGIGDKAFYKCSSLTSVTIGNSVTSIGYDAFRDCTGLTSVTIGNSVTSIGGSAFNGCSSLTSVTIPNSVTSIGNYVFSGCSSLTSVTIGNSVTSIGEDAFSGCSSLTSVTIGDGVTSIGEDAFRGCSSLTSPVYNAHCFAYMPSSYSGAYTIPEGIKQIAGSAFSGCKSLTSVTIPNSVKSIGLTAFYGCSSLTSVTCKATTPPTVGQYAFDGVSTSMPVYVPCGCVEAYKAANGWKDFTNIQGPLAEYSITVGVNATKMGTAKVDINNACGAQISAKPNIGYHFVQWSDGDTENPRTLELTQDTILTAEFAQSFSGQCGDNLYWEFIDDNLYITGNGTMYNYIQNKAPWTLFVSSIKSLSVSESTTSIGNYAFRNCSSLTSVTIGNSVTSIGDETFYGCSNITSVTWNAKNCNSYNFGSQVTSFEFGNEVEVVPSSLCKGMEKLTSVTIPNSVKTIGTSAFEGCVRLGEISLGKNLETIGANAFAECTRLYDIYTYATYPPFAEESSFANYNVYVYIPCEYQRDYTLDVVWGKFKFIECISTENVTTDEIVVTPSENEANVIWPSVSGAASYELVIKDKAGNIVCTLIFNANGQLTSIAFNAPSRNGVPAQAQSAGFSFTITGLDSGTGYDLTLTAKDNSGNAIQTETISFVTTGDNISTDMDQVQSNEVQSTKVIKDGQVLILRNGKTYTMQGQEVK